MLGNDGGDRPQRFAGFGELSADDRDKADSVARRPEFLHRDKADTAA
jgi:hypothetical protein